MRNLITRYRLSISTLWLAILISFYTTVFLNSHLWRELYQSQADFPASDKWEFLISASLIIWAIQAIILSLMFWGRSAKVIAILILLTAISANYFSDSYGIFYDVRMVQNIFATNKFEAQELIPGSIALTYLKHFVFLLFLIFFIDIKEKN